MVWQLVNGEEMMICQLHEMVKHGAGGMDMNRANEARDMTKKLGALAEKYQCEFFLLVI